ncbi:hypothetical protein E1263_06705 [Kribbella antibiotica]|uniref:Uncharacterized protein n=1 Tax=Kribbella antibiotica TaxID=190195 RepID=A0A4R4ZTV3_9ACTN|nr:hypothetical protein [Kribbella antibiotica]TDD61574.1 hypothetical protein E1263_06705 [Kribbella antibiotica]
MQLNELVRSWLPEGGTVVDRTGSEHAWPPLMKVAESAPASDDALTAVALTAVGDLPADAVPGEVVLLLLPWPPHELPLGPLIQALVSAGLQATEAHPLADTNWGVAVICRRVDDAVQEIHSYLDRSRKPGPLTGRTLLRLVDEHIVEGLVRRTQELALEAVTAERDALRKQLAAINTTPPAASATEGEVLLSSDDLG